MAKVDTAERLDNKGKPIVSLGKFTIKNWWFEGFTDGAVGIGRVPNEGPKFVLDADEWASVVSATCVGGQSGDIHYAVVNLLKGILPQPKVKPSAKKKEEEKTETEKAE